MAWTTADADLLEGQIREAIADGTWRARSIAFSDQVLTLNSLEDAFKLLALIRSAAATTTSRTRLAATSKGI